MNFSVSRIWNTGEESFVTEKQARSCATFVSSKGTNLYSLGCSLKRNPRIGDGFERSFKRSNPTPMFVTFSDGSICAADLGFHSLCSFHPRLYKFVGVGDRSFQPGRSFIG